VSVCADGAPARMRTKKALRGFVKVKQTINYSDSERNLKPEHSLQIYFI